MSTQAEILLICPSRDIREAIQGYLSKNGYHINPLATTIEARGVVSKRKFDLLIAEGDENEINELMNLIRFSNPGASLIVLSERGEFNGAMKSLTEGVDGCIFKPVREAEVRFEVGRVISSRGKERAAGEGKAKRYIHIDSRNRQMAELYDAAVNKIANSNSTVLIQGESGTGKELMTYWIYANSRRRNKPLVKVSCSVLPEGVLESELFGHEKGSFTGAYSKRKGRFELADGGTIFLDEIGEISPRIQGKFLRVLQEREFQRIGSNSTIKVDVRVIAATSRCLEEDVKEGRFREDLFYRLNVISLHIPPLRERKEDIPSLAEVFLRKYGSAAGRDIRGFDKKAMKLLEAYDWPGNVRELENAVERSVVLISGDIITPDDLPKNIIQQLSEEPPMDMTLRAARENFEQEYIRDVLARFRGNVSRTSRYLGLARKNLQEKLRKYSIDADEFR